MSTGLLTWPGCDLGGRTLEALQVPYTHTHTLAEKKNKKKKTHTHTRNQKALNMQALTTQALRQGQGLSSRPPAATPGWSHYLERESGRERDIKRDSCTGWPRENIKYGLQLKTRGSLHPHTYGTSSIYITGPGESTHRTQLKTHAHTPCPFSLTYIPWPWWLLYLRGEALNANMCFCPKEHLCVCVCVCVCLCTCLI